MAKIARLIGGAGTGKTTELLNIMEKAIKAGGFSPYEIGFVSFTKAARREASERATSLFNGISSNQLENDGWFRTLHAVCYRCLNINHLSVLAASKATATWLRETLDEDVSAAPNGDIMLGEMPGCGKTDAEMALGLWETARNRMETLYETWEKTNLCANGLPDMLRCKAIVTRYEQGKRLDDKVDFTDMLARFAGITFHPADAPIRTTPQGEVPNLPVWFFDEQQDTSALLDAVCHRLMENADWVYVVGDPMQAIYGWAGADSKLFQAWDAQKERIMPKSYRCPPAIHNLGEQILRGASDYWDRGIKPADHEGTISVDRYLPSIINNLDPTEDTLVLARTNFHARRLIRSVTDSCIPWVPTKGMGGWNAPSRMAALSGLYMIENGFGVGGHQWRQILKLIPNKIYNQAVIKRGTKKEWDEEGGKLSKKHIITMPDDIENIGGTRELVHLCQSKKWRTAIDGGSEYAEARDRWGEDVVNNPKVRVGTIHSAKGAEADNVYYLTTTSRPVEEAQSDQEGSNEERRVEYVAVTRTRRNLKIMVEPQKQYKADLPA